VTAIGPDVTAWLYAGSLVACGAAGLAGWAGWLLANRPRAPRTASILGALATVTVLAAWIARWVEAGHLPLFGTWESALSLALAVSLTASLAALSTFRTLPEAPPRLPVWAVTGPVAAGVLAHGLRYDATVYALTISERSWVVDVHAVLAWAAFGGLTLNAAFALARLLRPGRTTAIDRRLSMSLRVGFLLHSAMLASGSLYKFLLFGEVWTFDPVEILGFIAWMAYGTVLHLHLLGRWEGRRLAAWCLGLFVLLLVSYRGLVYFPAWSTYHIFDMDLRIHITGSETVP